MRDELLRVVRQLVQLDLATVYAAAHTGDGVALVALSDGRQQRSAAQVASPQRLIEPDGLTACVKTSLMPAVDQGDIAGVGPQSARPEHMLRVVPPGRFDRAAPLRLLAVGSLEVLLCRALVAVKRALLDHQVDVRVPVAGIVDRPGNRHQASDDR